jgi:hypothetical protein
MKFQIHTLKAFRSFTKNLNMADNTFELLESSKKSVKFKLQHKDDSFTDTLIEIEWENIIT